jgi:hypothetical protein
MSDAKVIIAKAKGENGYREGYANGSYNNKQKYSVETPGLEWSNYQAWCATFVSWVAYKTGLDALYPRTASCATGVSWFRNKGRFSYYPAIGAQVFYGANGGTHTGIVYKYSDAYIWTIEGNTNDSGSAEGNGVYLKQRDRKSSYVYGYGYPAFAEGIVCADPDWKGKKGVVYFGHEASEADVPAGGSTLKPPVTNPTTPPKGSNVDSIQTAGVHMHSLANNDVTTLKSDNWYVVDIAKNGNGDLLVGPNKAYSIQVQLVLNDVKVGAQVQGRFYLYKDGKATKSIAIERLGTAGGSFVDFAKIAGYLDPGESLRFEFLVFNDGTDFKLSQRAANVLYFN